MGPDGRTCRAVAVATSVSAYCHAEIFLQSFASGLPERGGDTRAWKADGNWQSILGDMESAVLKIDFSRSLQDLHPSSLQSAFNVTIADSNIICTAPYQGSGSPLLAAGSNRHVGDYGSSLRHQDSPSRRLSSVFPEMRDYLRTSRLRWLVDRCFHFKDGEDAEWTYEICVGKKVTQFMGSSKAGKTIGKTLLEWGTYKIGHDQLWANGTLTQNYGNGTGGRHAEVFFECLDQYPTVTAIEEVQENELRMWVGAPMFCDFRPSSPRPPLLESMLRPMEGWCANFTTSGWWSYEYCHPDSLVQFHKDSTGDVKDPMFLLGTLHRAGPSPNFLWSRPSGDFPMLRGKGSSGVNTKGSPKFRFLPVELVDSPTWIAKGRERPQQVLAMELSNGTRCDGTDVQRSTRILFECPEDFASLATHQVVKVMETSRCRHELLIHTPLVCPHPRLLPPRPKDPPHINCVPADSHQQESDLEALEPNKELVKSVPTPHLEAIPASYLPNAKISLQGSEFGMRYYKRYRASWTSPSFRVGRLVRHRWSKYTAVVLSWDRSCEAPREWIEKVYAYYPEASKEKPHYLLLVNQSHVADPPLPLFAYVPEIALEPASANQGVFRHPETSHFFHHFSNQSGHFVPLNHTSLLEMFQTDF
ncbi:hemimethylated DNA binding domain-containing protein [Besnoitia besnoiti]|uniref:Hemimethylated DNA binding domain-containing protein n=1 Tax=Besnoitia besnoiti TaxID=94643 RepID=A0A2A9M9K7_BESBE|nr:hemimethylated DNA binding domain-containing protein [Besnoitia besnoiti]PFH32297.1 hemimethylated DNA binding domain-containing protein [Besnoitia besnoiti]